MIFFYFFLDGPNAQNGFLCSLPQPVTVSQMVSVSDTLTCELTLNHELSMSLKFTAWMSSGSRFFCIQLQQPSLTWLNHLLSNPSQWVSLSVSGIGRTNSSGWLRLRVRELSYLLLVTFSLRNQPREISEVCVWATQPSTVDPWSGGPWRF